MSVVVSAEYHEASIITTPSSGSNCKTSEKGQGTESIVSVVHLGPEAFSYGCDVLFRLYKDVVPLEKGH